MSNLSNIPVPSRGWTAEAKVRFLEHLSFKGHVRAACARVGLSAEAAYRLRRRDQVFARGWAAAVALAREASEDALATRALDGVEEPVFYRGEQIGVRHRYDTRLLLAHLARLDRMVEWGGLVMEDAGRFDEILGLIAGAPFPEDMDEGDDLLPVSRTGQDEQAVRMAEDYEWETAEDEFEEPWAHHAETDAEEQALQDTGRAARKAAKAQREAWFAEVCAAVDRVGGTEQSSTKEEAAPSGIASSGNDPSTVSTVSTSALARGIAEPDRGFAVADHPAFHAGKRRP